MLRISDCSNTNTLICSDVIRKYPGSPTFIDILVELKTSLISVRERVTCEPIDFTQLSNFLKTLDTSSTSYHTFENIDRTFRLKFYSLKEGTLKLNGMLTDNQYENVSQFDMNLDKDDIPLLVNNLEKYISDIQNHCNDISS